MSTKKLREPRFVEIAKVDVVKGITLNSNWRRWDMYIIADTQGNIYIENTVFHDFAAWEPIHWKEGDKAFVEVIEDSGYNWLKPIRDKDKNQMIYQNTSTKVNRSEI